MTGEVAEGEIKRTTFLQPSIIIKPQYSGCPCGPFTIGDAAKVPCGHQDSVAS